MNRIIIQSKKLAETAFYPPEGFNFIPALNAGETISSAVVSVTLYTGVDSNPSAMLSGSPSINAAGNTVTQLITGGVVGAVYSLLCRATTNLGQTLSLVGFLFVDPGVA